MIIFGKPCKYLSKQFFLMENCRFPSVFPVFLKTDPNSSTEIAALF